MAMIIDDDNASPVDSHIFLFCTLSQNAIVRRLLLDATLPTLRGSLVDALLEQSAAAVDAIDAIEYEVASKDYAT
jgi:hypothetical protein